MPREQKREFYAGNANLPTQHAEFDYSEHPEWVRNIEKSRTNILYFAENFFFIINLDKGKQLIELHKYQKKILKTLRDNRFTVVLSSRQSGKTTLMTIYALWIACFQEDQRILIVANKETTAIRIFGKIRLAYEHLPNYLKPGVTEYAKTSMILANGSSIGISTTSSDAGRGDSCNVLILDELAFIDNHLVQEFWRSVYPIISASQKSKIFIASTPNGTENLFYDLYKGAENGANGWARERVDWWEVPGRDEKWKEQTTRSMGSADAFAQEYENVFLKTGESAVDEQLAARLKEDIKDPAYVYEDGHYFVWEPPSKDRLYVAGVDVSEGVGQAATVMQILDITDLKNIEQVAIYHNNMINPIQFTQKCLEILQHWGNPPACIERNNCGAQVVDNLRLQHSYQNLVSYGPKISDKTFSRNGILAHTNTKYKGVINMRYYLNELRVVIPAQ